MNALIEIKKDALLSNIRCIRDYTNKKIIGVVKAQAYGIGLHDTVSILDEYVDAWAVDDIDELHSIRFRTDKDVYMLGYTMHEDIEKMLMLRGIPVVYDEDTLRKIDDTAHFLEMKTSIMVKIDAHLGRQGLRDESEIQSLIHVLKSCKNVSLRGVYAHFANLEDTDEMEYAQSQLRAFSEVCDMFQKSGWTGIETHISATAGMILEIDSCTHVRLGIGMYGLWPSDKLKLDYGSRLRLQPVMRWVSYIAQLKNIQKGQSIGYGRTFIAPQDMRIAIIPQGYSDGYIRLLSNKGEVLIQGVRCPVRGRVAMNMFAVDVSHLKNVLREDEVVLLGSQGNEEISAEEVAQLCGTISYEVLTWINPLLPRRVIMT